MVEVGTYDSTYEVTEDAVDDEMKENLEISIHAITGTLGCSTMKVEGRVNNRKLQLLIDFGSRHSLLDISIAERLGYITELVPPLCVRLANGSEMACNRKCKGFQ